MKKQKTQKRRDIRRLKIVGGLNNRNKNKYIEKLEFNTLWD